MSRSTGIVESVFFRLLWLMEQTAGVGEVRGVAGGVGRGERARLVSACGEGTGGVSYGF